MRVKSARRFVSEQGCREVASRAVVLSATSSDARRGRMELASGGFRATRHGCMKNKTRSQKPTRSKLSILRQLCNYIPPPLVPKVARKTGVDTKARTYLPWSHVVTLLFAQLTHSLGLNDVCDALRLHSGPGYSRILVGRVA